MHAWIDDEIGSGQTSSKYQHVVSTQNFIHRIRERIRFLRDRSLKTYINITAT